MIGVIVTIGPSKDLNRERATAVAEQEGPKFEGIDGLQSKVFMWNDETGTVTNTYDQGDGALCREGANLFLVVCESGVRTVSVWKGP